MRFGSLFAGIGGFDLGLERAGMECAWQVEIDDYATKVLTKHWPAVPKFRDVRECGSGNLEPVDLICGGFPCQPHSFAGKRKASADERDLWGEFARIIRELRPRWVLAENVPGLLSSEAGRFFGRVLGDLASCGYCVEWDCIPACAVGAPHRRDRVWIVAYADRPEQGRRSQSEWQQKRRDADASWNGAQGAVVNTDGVHRQRRDSAGLQGETGSSAGCNWWAVEPELGRLAHGVPHRVDRLRCLGNAVVPQVVEWIGRRIMQAECTDADLA